MLRNLKLETPAVWIKKCIHFNQLILSFGFDSITGIIARPARNVPAPVEPHTARLYHLQRLDTYVAGRKADALLFVETNLNFSILLIYSISFEIFLHLVSNTEFRCKAGPSSALHRRRICYSIDVRDRNLVTLPIFGIEEMASSLTTFVWVHSETPTH